MSKHQPAKADSRRAQLRAAQIEQAKRDKNKRIAIMAVVGVVVVALVVGVILLVNRAGEAEVANTPPSANADRTGLRASDAEPKADAPLVSIFLDYQCPACARFEQTFGPKLDELAANGDIALEYRTMTFMDTNLRNDTSTRAANAAVCADASGHYREYHNAIFAYQAAANGQGGISDEIMTQDFTQQAGISGPALDEFNACYSNKRFSGFVNNVDQEAGRSGVTGTPTVHVNGNALDMNTLADPNTLLEQIQAAA